MRKDRITFETPLLQLKDISRRTKINELKNPDEYAVLKVSYYDPFDGHALAFRSKQRKIYTLMCFEKEIFERLIVGECFIFKGTISLEYGATYFCVEKALDELGFEINEKESEFFTANIVYSLEDFKGLEAA